MGGPLKFQISVYGPIKFPIELLVNQKHKFNGYILDFCVHFGPPRRSLRAPKWPMVHDDIWHKNVMMLKYCLCEGGISVILSLLFLALWPQIATKVKKVFFKHWSAILIVFTTFLMLLNVQVCFFFFFSHSCTWFNYGFFLLVSLMQTPK